MASRFPFFSQSIVRRLLSYKKYPSDPEEEDSEWSDKAVKSLVKKLKTKGGLQELERALETEGREPTGCITIERSLDGRLQVSQKKVVPHLTYCRIWRWPDLENHYELKPIHTCQFPYQSKKEEVCVNPYHYEVVKAPDLPPVLVPPLTHYENNNYSSTEPPPPHYSEETPPPAYGEEFNTTLLSIDSPSSSSVGSPILSPDSCGSLVPSPEPSLVPPPISYQQVAYIEPAFWCSVNYYELKAHVGEAFDATKTTFTVDGFTDPGSKDRFCVGRLCNVDRDEVTLNTRRHIGKGLRVFKVAGKVYVECLSNYSIFVQSPNGNLRNGYCPITVTKVVPGAYLDLFDSNDFARRLEQAVQYGFEAVYQLQRLCAIRISFVKGWGAEYRRDCITSTPCWIEIQLNGPLQWIDRVLTQMGAPIGDIRSDT